VLVEFVKALSSLSSQNADARKDFYEQGMDHGKSLSITMWAEVVTLSQAVQNGFR
jgi:hypothetical protein